MWCVCVFVSILVCACAAQNSSNFGYQMAAHLKLSLAIICHCRSLSVDSRQVYSLRSTCVCLYASANKKPRGTTYIVVGIKDFCRLLCTSTNKYQSGYFILDACLPGITCDTRGNRVLKGQIYLRSAIFCEKCNKVLREQSSTHHAYLTIIHI